MKQPVSLLHRFLSAIVGLFIGAVLGMLALAFAVPASSFTRLGLPTLFDR